MHRNVFQREWTSCFFGSEKLGRALFTRGQQIHGKHLCHHVGVSLGRHKRCVRISFKFHFSDWNTTLVYLTSFTWGHWLKQALLFFLKAFTSVERVGEEEYWMHSLYMTVVSTWGRRRLEWFFPLVTVLSPGPEASSSAWFTLTCSFSTINKETIVPILWPQ